MKGLEPSTFCMASRRSSQLSYIRGSADYRAGAAPRPAAEGSAQRPGEPRRGAAPGASPGAAPAGQLTGGGAPWAGA